MLASLLLAGAMPVAAADPDLAALRQERREVAALLIASYVFVGGGSGVLISAEGEVLTNFHVAGDQPEWRVRLADGRAFPAKHVASDPIGDLTLLRITAPEGTRFTHVQLGAEADLVPGTPVLAIGNPFSLGDLDDTPTLSAGALGSGRMVRGDYTDCVQLDAPVNPGNSGGPLLDLSGRLLGINGQIRTRTGMRANSGIGLAIACTQIAAFLPVMRASTSGWVHHAAAPEGLVLEQSLSGPVVKSWTPRVTAESGLLLPGDRVLTIAGRPATSRETAMGLFGWLPWTGKDMRVPVTVLRKGQEQGLSVPVTRHRIRPAVDLGLRTVRKTSTDADGAERDVIAVSGVDPASPAAKAAIVAGWEILRVDGATIASRLDLLKALAPVDVGDVVTFVFRQPGGEEVEKPVSIGR